MDDHIFKTTMGKFATGVTIITTELNGEVQGMTANAFMSVSLDPKLILISVANKAKMNESIKKSGIFAVSLLANDQEEMSMYFAGQIKEKRDIAFKSFNGMPVIDGALANITCDVHNTHVEGDHTLYIGSVRDIELKEEGKPLTYFSGRYYEIS
ncbi:flavin reductase family protein [Paenisporosarcina sp. TG20]|uniref:flavin reductase family protein n=1 Tax=Paenisporosarcina sp. TG20 TaxID=1211706 RepID=UPI00030E61B4|nr:flavin reductase family protein [Paenisporosarcina sp. TG20]